MKAERWYHTWIANGSPSAGVCRLSGAVADPENAPDDDGTLYCPCANIVLRFPECPVFHQLMTTLRQSKGLRAFTPEDMQRAMDIHAAS
eukprot:2983776-Pyramimonas_sp.AAC.1